MSPARFHVHVYFDDATRAAALRIREEVQKGYPVEMGPVHDGPIGPHPLPSYQIDIPLEQFTPIVTLLMLHREGVDILVHPRTGDDVADHTVHALWLGQPQPINVEFLRRHA